MAGGVNLVRYPLPVPLLSEFATQMIPALMARPTGAFWPP